MKPQDLFLKTPKSFDDVANKVALLVWDGLREDGFFTVDPHEFPTLTKRLAQTLRMNIDTCPDAAKRSWDQRARAGDNPLSNEAMRKTRLQRLLDQSNLLMELESTSLAYFVRPSTNPEKKSELTGIIRTIFRDRITPYLADILFYAEPEIPPSSLATPSDTKPRTRLTISTAHKRATPPPSFRSAT